ncbi:MAG TPA: DNA polymerase III subunit beta [Solirubrobacterales bacterium]|nr:DNA polymerase III subunit beta [Solirubrobacterales bacterium]
MELQIGIDELNRALYRAQGIVEKKSTMPILGSVLLEATADGRLRVSAYDLEIGVTGTYPAEVMKAGAVAIRHKEFFDIVRALPERTAVLRREANNRVRLTSGSAEFNIVGQPAEDYPPFPRAEKVPLVAIEPTQLLEMIEKTQFAISADETRHNLNGVYFEPIEGAVRLVATDGHRLCMVERQLAGDFGLKRGVIVPRKGLLELRRLLSEDGTGPAELGFTETSGLFRRGDLTTVMRLIDGQFPDYMQVIPKEADRVVQIDRPRLLETLKRMSLLSSDRSTNAVKIELQPDLLRVSSQNPDLGEAKEEIAVAYQGTPLQIGFNARYLMDILQVVDTPQVRLELCDELSPGVLKPATEGAPESRYTAVVMPMRI